MNSPALQRFVRKVFSDEKTRTQFVSDPESVLSRFKLTAGEKQAVLQTHHKLGLVGCGTALLEETVGPNSLWTSPVP